MDKPRVKPLEWEDFGDRAAKANAMLLTNYLIDMWSDGRFEVTVSSPGYGTGFDGKRWHGSMSDAKAAAQADYEARILAALEPEPVTDGPNWEGFGRDLLESWPVRDVDGSELFDAALRNGLILEIPGGYDPEQHIDAEGISPERGDPWYEYAFRVLA